MKKEKSKQKKEDRTDLEKFQDSFIREVDEELKNDQAREIWKKYGFYIVMAVVLIVTFTVSFETFKVLHERKNQTWSDRYAYALNLQVQGRYDESLKILNEVIEHKHDIYSDLAKIQVSNIYFEQGDTDKAIAELEEIVKDKSINKKLKDISVIKLASYKLDEAPREEIVELLSPLAENGSGWVNIAKEMLAMLEIREGNIEAAKDMYKEILDSKELSEPLKIRVQDMLSVLDEVQ